MADVLNSQNMEQLATLVEEATRSTEEGVKRFIEPAHGTLRRATNRRHHFVFGRRGSGKSSLLRKAAADLTVDRRPIAYVDLEAFKGHSYPDVLISVLVRTFREFQEWLNSAAIHPANRRRFWQRLFGRAPTRPGFNRKESARLAERLGSEIQELEKQLHAPEESNLSVKSGRRSESGQKSGFQAKVGASSASIAARGSKADAVSASSEVSEEFKRRKIDFLLRHILDYQQIFDDMARLSEGDAYLLLDDLYHIRRVDHPHVVDYFHRIAKNHHLWLKIGTIRHRTDWYLHGTPPIGVKLGDDADEIDLDLSLEKYALAKEFLLKILSAFAHECDLNPDDFLTDGAKDRLVLASGGVARDFLSIFRRSIDIARERERGGGARGPRIGAEDVNVAAGEYDTSKREEFKRDTLGDDAALDNCFQKVGDFCLEKASSNCFLLDKDAKGKNVQLIRELVDLKLLHLVRSRVTVSGRRGKIFEAYMLDLSQYAGARKRRGLELIEFWKAEAKEQLRRASLIFEPALID